MSILSFSGGFPILYLIGFINFFIMFWVYKYLQVHHYQKSLIFNKDMADSLIFHLKLALMQHVVFTCFIYSTDILQINTNFQTMQNIHDILYLSIQGTSVEFNSFTQRLFSNSGITQVTIFFALIFMLIILPFLLLGLSKLFNLIDWTSISKRY